MICNSKKFCALSFSLECTDFKNFLSPFWCCRGWMIIDVQISSKPKTPKILNENLIKIGKIQNLSSVTSKIIFWPKRPRKGLSEFFQKLHCWNQCIPRKKIRYVIASWSTFSLNLFTEEVWQLVRRLQKRNFGFWILDLGSWILLS